MSTRITGVLAALILIFSVVAVIYLFRVFNSPDGERYMKARTQGPFVPDPSEKHASQTKDQGS
jgi:hypothetical protein